MMIERNFNCPNCGAPISADVCPYCGTAFLDWAAFDMARPTYVKIKTDQGQVIMLRVIPTSLRLAARNDPAILYADSRIAHRVDRWSYDIEAELSAVPWTDPATGQEIMSKVLYDV